MKQKFISIFILILLSSCYSIAPAPTATATPANTNTPLPIEPPISAPTNTPFPESEIPTAKPEIKPIDISNPEKFRTVEWDYLISPAYLAELQSKEEAGELPNVSKDAVYVKPGYVSYKPDSEPTIMIKNNNFDLLFTISSSSTYTDVNNRPYTLVDIVKTKISGVDFYLYVIKWDNDPSVDKSSGFLGYITPISSYTNKIGLNKIVGNTSEKYVTGLYISDIHGTITTTACNKVLGNTVDSNNSIVDFCEYYTEAQNKLIQPEIYRTWSKTGVLSNNSLLPISFAAITNTSK